MLRILAQTAEDVNWGDEATPNHHCQVCRRSSPRFSLAPIRGRTLLPPRIAITRYTLVLWRRNHHPPPDTLNQRLGVLNRREAEARILQAFLQRLESEFDAGRVREILRETIIAIAHEQAPPWPTNRGDDGLPAFANTLPAWQRDGALEIEELERGEDAFHFNVTRCRYAEMYRASASRSWAPCSPATATSP